MTVILEIRRAATVTKKSALSLDSGSPFQNELRAAVEAAESERVDWLPVAKDACALYLEGGWRCLGGRGREWPVWRLVNPGTASTTPRSSFFRSSTELGLAELPAG